MAAQIPIKSDAAANERALEKVRQDKLREVRDGHDGTWVAHPGLVRLAREVFDEHMPGPNQIENKREDVRVSADDLLEPPKGPRTDAALRHNVRVGVQYIAAWLDGNGCVPIYNLMEDAATAEISRTQIWQWVKHGVTTDDGRPVTKERVARTLDEELEVVRRELGDARFERAAFGPAKQLFLEVATSEELVPFLTLPAYERLLEREKR
jgi:malate synthase